MLLSLIAAFAEQRVIGNQNRLPWHLPADLKHFRAVTWGKPVLMGRKTFESIGKPLPGRLNILITRSTVYRAPPGCLVLNSLQEAVAFGSAYPEIIAIGGASVYAQALPLVRRMYLTLIHHAFAGDAYFPEFCRGAWREIERADCKPDADNPYPYSFVTLERQTEPRSRRRAGGGCRL